METSISAENITIIQLTTVRGNLTIKGWEQPIISVNSSSEIDRAIQEGQILQFATCEGDLTLSVPHHIIVRLHKGERNVTVENVRQAELRHIHGGLRLAYLAQESSIHQVGGNLSAEQIASLRITGSVGGNASLRALELLEVHSIGGDLLLEQVDVASVGNVGKGLMVHGIVGLRASNIGKDCIVQDGHEATIDLGNIGKTLHIEGATRVYAGHVGGDCHIEKNAHVDVQLHDIGKDLSVTGATRLRVGHIGGSCDVRDVQGEIAVGQVGRDAVFHGVVSDLRVGNIGGNATMKGIQGNIASGNIGKDLYLQSSFPPTSHLRLQVGKDATVVLPPQASLALSAQIGGRLQGRTLTSDTNGHQISLTYGSGEARLQLNVGHDLILAGDEAPASSSNSSWKWQDFAQEMSGMGQNMGADISDAFNQAAMAFQHEFSTNFNRATDWQRPPFAPGSTAERAQDRRPGERLNIRLHNREWHVDSGRIERLLAEAQRAATEGINGAFEAVEQALKNLSIVVPSATPPYYTPPASPVTPDESVQQQPVQPPMGFSEDAHVVEPGAAETASDESLEGSRPSATPFSREQEREAILRMIAAGRITPEEGDMLLEAL